MNHDKNPSKRILFEELPESPTSKRYPFSSEEQMKSKPCKIKTYITLSSKMNYPRVSPNMYNNRHAGDPCEIVTYQESKDLSRELKKKIKTVEKCRLI